MPDPIGNMNLRGTEVEPINPNASRALEGAVQNQLHRQARGLCPTDPKNNSISDAAVCPPRAKIQEVADADI